MVNSPKPSFAGAIRNDEADFVFKYFGSYPSWMERWYDERTIATQDVISNVWAQFIKTGEIEKSDGDYATEFKDGHCLIGMEYDQDLYMVCLYCMFDTVGVTLCLGL